MDLLKSLLLEILRGEELSVAFPGWTMEKLVRQIDMKTFSALRQIQLILRDHTLSDFQCIEEIVNVLEAMEIRCGTRHDF